MTLQVPFEEVAAAAKRYEIKELYLNVADGIGRVSGFNPELSVLVYARTEKPESEIRTAIETASCQLFKGSWSEKPLSEEEDGDMYVAAVSYQSGEHTPGVWMDAYRGQPTHVQVLEAIYNEFRQTGELSEVTIEEFINGANPNVVVSSMSQLKGFIETKERPPC
jgi:hypothetical protein